MTLHRSTAAGVVLLTALIIAGCAAARRASSPPVGSSTPVASGLVSPSSSAAAGSTAVPTPIAVLPSEPWIAYQTDIGGGAQQTYLMRPDGTDAHPFTVDGEGKGKHPDWSPDGRRLAFNVNDDIWVADVDGLHAKTLTTDGCCDFPAWSPDGMKLAFTGYPAETLGTKPISSWIRVLDVATGQAITVVQTKRPLLVDVPRWSPDGKELVVGVHQMDSEGFEIGAAIAVVPATGGKLRYLTKFDAFAFDPDWSWATNRIVFDNQTIGYQKAPGPGENASNLHIIQPDGTGLRQLTDVAQGTFIIQPTWAPDGKSVLADIAGQWLGVRIDPVTGTVDNFAACCVSHPRLRPTP